MDNTRPTTRAPVTNVSEEMPKGKCGGDARAKVVERVGGAELGKKREAGAKKEGARIQKTRNDKTNDKKTIKAPPLDTELMPSAICIDNSNVHMTNVPMPDALSWPSEGWRDGDDGEGKRCHGGRRRTRAPARSLQKARNENV